MKNLMSLKGAKTLSKMQQKAIHGGAMGGCGDCTGKPAGAICSNWNCTCFGVCSNGPGGPCDMF